MCRRLRTYVALKAIPLFSGYTYVISHPRLSTIKSALPIFFLFSIFAFRGCKGKQQLYRRSVNVKKRTYAHSLSMTLTSRHSRSYPEPHLAASLLAMTLCNRKFPTLEPSNPAASCTVSIPYIIAPRPSVPKSTHEYFLPPLNWMFFSGQTGILKLLYAAHSIPQVALCSLAYF